MATIVPLAPSALLAPTGTLAPEGETIYTDAPIGRIGGTLVIGGGGIVKVGGSNVNQEPPRRQPRTYPQQQPPRLIHIEYQFGHDAPTGRISLTGTASSTHERPVFRVTSGSYQAEPTIQDVLAAQRRARRIIRQKVGT